MQQRQFKDMLREIDFASHFLSFSVTANIGKVVPKFVGLCAGSQMGDLRLFNS